MGGLLGMKEENVMTKVVKINTPASESPNFAAQIVSKAYAYTSSISIEAGNKRVNAKSLVGLISLMLNNGESVTLHAEGPDEDDATMELGSFLTNAVCE